MNPTLLWYKTGFKCVLVESAWHILTHIKNWGEASLSLKFDFVQRSTKRLNLLFLLKEQVPTSIQVEQEKLGQKLKLCDYCGLIKPLTTNTKKTWLCLRSSPFWFLASSGNKPSNPLEGEPVTPIKPVRPSAMPSIKLRIGCLGLALAHETSVETTRQLPFFERLSENMCNVDT